MARGTDLGAAMFALPCNPNGLGVPHLLLPGTLLYGGQTRHKINALVRVVDMTLVAPVVTRDVVRQKPEGYYLLEITVFEHLDIGPR